MESRARRRQRELGFMDRLRGWFFQPCLHLISRGGLQATLWSSNLRVAWLCRGNSAFFMPFLVMKWATNPVLFALWLKKLCEQLNSCEASRTSNWASLLESATLLKLYFSCLRKPKLRISWPAKYNLNPILIESQVRFLFWVLQQKHFLTQLS